MSITLFARQAIASLNALRYKWIILTTLLASFLLIGASSVYSHTIPTISILSVKTGESVTIRTHNFPAGYQFTVTMGKMGTRGVGGTVITTQPSGNGGSFDVTYPIPEGLRNDHQIAIRLQTAHANPYYAFNWFFNAPSTVGTDDRRPAVTTKPYVGIPTFKIIEVSRDKTVTIETNNFPASQNFTVTMGLFGRRGIGGIVVDTFDSGEGGRLTKTFNIPADLHGLNRIAIRAQTGHAYPYYAYNWFFNSSTEDNSAASTGQGAGVAPATTTPAAAPAFVGIPTFKVCSVARDNSIRIVTGPMPANQDFFVTMGIMYTQGVGGYAAGSFNSGDGSPQSVTLTIPANLYGLHRISVRAQTAHANPFYAYNWFYNNTATVC